MVEDLQSYNISNSIKPAINNDSLDVKERLHEP